MVLHHSSHPVQLCHWYSGDVGWVDLLRHCLLRSRDEMGETSRDGRNGERVHKETKTQLLPRSTAACWWTQVRATVAWT